MTFSRYLVVFFALALLPWMPAQTAQQQTTAAVPRLVNYSGRAVGDHGTVLSGVAGVTFSIYKDQHEGAPLWTETQTVRLDSKGNYNAQLGAATTEGLPLDMFTSGEARWLGVRISGQSEEQPRVLLVTVPYALRAEDAATLGGLPASAFVLASRGAISGVSASQTGATTSQAAILPPAVSGSGTTSYLPIWSNASTLGTSAVFQTGSGSSVKLGINTSSPQAMLDVKGSATIRATLNLPATATAKSTAGANSSPLGLVASAYNSNTRSAANQVFHWMAEPAGNNTASPSATLNLLFASAPNSLAETGLKIDHKGLITFAPGQTFPGGNGSGTVTSVGLSAPTSDFTVTGSPVTAAGILGLSWKVAPASADVANAIVKRDGSGNFAASGIQAVALSVSNPTGAAVFGASGGSSGGSDGVHGETASAAGSGVAGVNQNGGVGVYGTSNGLAVYGISSGSQAIWGESNGTTFTNGSGPDGVHGVAHSSAGSGVGGLNTAAGGVGVWGEAPGGIGFYTPNNVQQARSAGGWVKAMIYVNADAPPYSIVRCFNSNLAGSAATTPPCGINFTENDLGDWVFDFGFEVDDRFYSATFTENAFDGFIRVFPLSKNRLDVVTKNGTDGVPAEFSLIVF